MINAALLSLALLATTTGVVPIPVESAPYLTQVLRDCIDENAVQYSRSDESVDTITKATIFACSAKRQALREFLVLEEQRVVGVYSDSAEEIVRVKLVDELMQSVDETLRSRIAYLVLSERAK